MNNIQFFLSLYLCHSVTDIPSYSLSLYFWLKLSLSLSHQFVCACIHLEVVGVEVMDPASFQLSYHSHFASIALCQHHTYNCQITYMRWHHTQNIGRQYKTHTENMHTTQDTNKEREKDSDSDSDTPWRE